MQICDCCVEKGWVMEGMQVGDWPRLVHFRALKVTFTVLGISEGSKWGSDMLRFQAQKHHFSKSVENRGEPGQSRGRETC